MRGTKHGKSGGILGESRAGWRDMQHETGRSKVREREGLIVFLFTVVYFCLSFCVVLLDCVYELCFHCLRFCVSLACWYCA
jgi:hypothetical protein